MRDQVTICREHHATLLGEQPSVGPPAGPALFSPGAGAGVWVASELHLVNVSSTRATRMVPELDPVLVPAQPPVSTCGQYLMAF
jgi:hypothetical protein